MRNLKEPFSWPRVWENSLAGVLVLSVAAFLSFLLKYLTSWWNSGLPGQAIIILLPLLVISCVLYLFRNRISRKSKIVLTVSGFAILLAFGLLYAGFLYGSNRQRQLDESKSLLKVMTHYDFEDNEEVQKWFPVSSTSKCISEGRKAVSDTKFAHSGGHSLRLDVDMQEYKPTEVAGYACIHNPKMSIASAKLITAWVLVPSLEELHGITFLAQIIVYPRPEKDPEMRILSEPKNLVSGVWDPITLGTFASIDYTAGLPEDIRSIEWGGEIMQMIITVWANQHYKGPIYFDDIAIYSDSADDR